MHDSPWSRFFNSYFWVSNKGRMEKSSRPWWVKLQSAPKDWWQSSELSKSLRRSPSLGTLSVKRRSLKKHQSDVSTSIEVGYWRWVPRGMSSTETPQPIEVRMASDVMPNRSPPSKVPRSRLAESSAPVAPIHLAGRFCIYAAARTSRSPPPMPSCLVCDVNGRKSSGLWTREQSDVWMNLLTSCGLVCWVDLGSRPWQWVDWEGASCIPRHIVWKQCVRTPHPQSRIRYIPRAK